MCRGLLKYTATCLALAALTAFIFHPDHLRSEAGPETSSHCSVCHTVPIGLALPPSDHPPIDYVTYDIGETNERRISQLPFSSASPRGPPSA